MIPGKAIDARRTPGRVFLIDFVFSDMTTSHSTNLPKGVSQVAGYVANCFFMQAKCQGVMP